MKLTVKAIVQDVVKKNGLWVPGREIVVAENSWLKAIALLHEGLLDRTNTTIKDTGGTDRLFDQDRQYIMRATAGATATTYGILVGTGTTAVDRDDYALDTLIAHGVGAGQLYYQACTVTGPTAITGGYREAIARQVDNSSGGSITVEEVGLAIQFTYTPTATSYALILRDLTGSVAIADAASKLFTYQVDFLA